MSKHTRTLLISGIALVTLVGVLLAVIFLIPPATDGSGDGGTTTTTRNETVVLVDKKEGVTVNSVTITRPDETFTVVKNGKNGMIVKGYEDLPQHSAAYETLEDALLGFGAYRAITAEHPEDYGFDTDKKTTTISVAYSDDTTFTFEIGNATPSGDGYYLRHADSAAIHLVDAAFAQTVSAKSTYYLSTMPLVAPTAQNENDELVVRNVTLSGSVRPTPLTFQISTDVPDDSQQAQMLTGFYLTKPYLRNVRSGTQMLSASSYYGFTASDVAKVRPTAADLKKYGLTNPYSECVASLSIKRITSEVDKTTGKTVKTMSFYNTFEYTLKLGNETENGERYAVLYQDGEMIPLVYTVAPSSLVWAEAQYDEIADDLLFFTYIYQIEEMDITMDGVTTEFDLYHNADAEERDDQMTVISDGTRYSTDSFRTLYSTLMMIMRSGSVDKVPAGDPVLTIEIETNTSIAHTGWIKVYRYSAGKYAILHDTGELHLADATRVEGFMEDYRKFLAGNKL